MFRSRTGNFVIPCTLFLFHFINLRSLCLLQRLFTFYEMFILTRVNVGYRLLYSKHSCSHVDTCFYNRFQALWSLNEHRQLNQVEFWPIRDFELVVTYGWRPLLYLLKVNYGGVNNCSLCKNSRTLSLFFISE